MKWLPSLKCSRSRPLSGEILMYTAQSGLFHTWTMPLIVFPDGTMNFLGLTPHSFDKMGGFFGDYWTTPPTLEFYDSKYLTTPLLNSAAAAPYSTPWKGMSKLVVGVDLESVGGECRRFESNSPQYGIDNWQVVLKPATMSVATTDDPEFGYSSMAPYFLNGSPSEALAQSNMCKQARALLGPVGTRWKAKQPGDGSMVDQNGDFRCFPVSPVIDILWFGEGGTAAPSSDCYFAGAMAHELEDETMTSFAFTGQVSVLGEKEMPDTVLVQIATTGVYKAAINIKLKNGDMDMTYLAPKSHTETRAMNYLGMVLHAHLGMVN